MQPWAGVNGVLVQANWLDVARSRAPEIILEPSPSPTRPHRAFALVQDMGNIAGHSVDEVISVPEDDSVRVALRWKANLS